MSLPFFAVKAMGVGTSQLLRNKPRFLKICQHNKFEMFFLSLLKQPKSPTSIVKMSSTTTQDNVKNLASKAWSKSSVSDSYEQARPDYNHDSVEFLLSKFGALQPRSEEFVIAELGAGTGKYTRAMKRVLEQHPRENVKIIATEPVGGMCKKFKEMVPDVKILQCAASNIDLPSNSADAVVAAQCFHWFTDAQSIADIHRVLKPKGILGIVWILPDRSVTWIKTIEEMLEVGYKKNKVARPEFSKEWLHQMNSHGGFGPVNEDNSYKYSTEHSYEGIIQRYNSVSLVSAAEGSHKENMLKVIEDAVKSSQVKGQDTYTFHYVVRMKWFQKL